MPGEIFPSLTFYDEQKNIFQNIPVAENTNQQVFACKEFESIRAMKNSFMMVDRKGEKTQVPWIAMVPYLFSLKE